VQDIHALVQSLGVSSFHLLGHSMGGQIYLAYALSYPEAVKTLTLADSVPAEGLSLTDDDRIAFRQMQQNEIILFQAVEMCFPYFKDEAAIQSFWQDARHCSREIYITNPETMHATRLIDQAGSTVTPTLILHGREDVIIPVAAMDKTIKTMKHARVVLLEKCGHSPFIERPAVAASVFFDFINEYEQKN
jgi:pimeloyl-ACP methyl ester carboxylesterase